MRIFLYFFIGLFAGFIFSLAVILQAVVFSIFNVIRSLIEQHRKVKVAESARRMNPTNDHLIPE